jgi:protoheme IX farnesyltransferase
MVGKVSLVIVVIANLFMILRCVGLYRNMDVAAARKVMFGSYLYLPVVFFALLSAKA